MHGFRIVAFKSKKLAPSWRKHTWAAQAKGSFLSQEPLHLPSDGKTRRTGTGSRAAPRSVGQRKGTAARACGWPPRCASASEPPCCTPRGRGGGVVPTLVVVDGSSRGSSGDSSRRGRRVAVVDADLSVDASEQAGQWTGCRVAARRAGSRAAIEGRWGVGVWGWPRYPRRRQGTTARCRGRSTG